jgi:hypothetical protein
MVELYLYFPHTSIYLFLPSQLYPGNGQSGLKQGEGNYLAGCADISVPRRTMGPELVPLPGRASVSYCSTGEASIKGPNGHYCHALFLYSYPSQSSSWHRPSFN